MSDLTDIFPLLSGLVAEVTQPSLGVGYEIGRAVDLKKNILCLFRPDSGKSKYNVHDYVSLNQTTPRHESIISYLNLCRH